MSETAATASVTGVMVEPISTLMYMAMGAFVSIYIGLSLLYGDKYLASNPTQSINPEKPRTNEEIKDEYEEWHKEQNFSGVLAGFSVSALAFILASPSLREDMQIVEFFSFAFIFEMISFLSYKYMVERRYEFYGTLFQYAGLLALLNGFLIFIIGKVGVSHMLALAFGIGYMEFFALSSLPLNIYISHMRAYNKNKG